MSRTVGTTRRVNRGRGHSYLLNGHEVPGVTTILSGGVPKPALSYWAARETAEFAVDNLTLLAQLDDRDAAIDLLKGAPWRDRDRAARRGTEVHSIGERLVHGEEVDVPDELVGHVDSYMRFLDDHQVEPVLVEFTVVSHRWKYMGTGDLIARLGNGQTLLLDLKTTRSGIYGEVALQLAAYRYADTYLDDQGAEQPMPTVDGCAAVWVRADGYDVVPLRADEATFRTFLYAAEIAKFAKAAADYVGDVLAPGATL